MITSKNTALIGLSALFAFALTQGCGSDDSGPGGGAGAGVAGAAAGSGGGSPVAGAGGAVAGAPGVSGGGSGGAAAGSGGAAAGSGGAAAGSGGAAAGSGGSGGGSAGAGGGAAGPKFSEVSTIITASCTGNGCHTGGQHINFTNPGANGLYGLLTTNIPNGTEHCQGSKLVDPATPANSFLPKVISGNNQTCKNNGADQTVPRMPYMCSTTGNNPRPCLTAAQIKTITDWVTAGAKND